METNIKLMVVFSKMVKVFAEQVGKNLEKLGMPYSDYPILAHLNEVGRAKTQKLGEVAIITSGTITHTVNKLVKQGYVDKVQDDEDRRVYWVQITDQGRQAFNQVHEAHLKHLNYLFEDFTEEEKIGFIDTLKQLGTKVVLK
jgi:MarR family 2-MHQ and catechol resistance regulon transcriptional repressor